VIATRTDTGKPAYIEARRNVHRDGTAVMLEIYTRNQIQLVLVLQDEEAVGHIRELARCLPRAELAMLVDELGR
jgi:hypothetical protein